MKVRERTNRISPRVWGLGLLEENDCLLRRTKKQGDMKGEGVCGGEQRSSLQDRTVSLWPKDESRERASGDSHSGCHHFLPRIRIMGV